MLSPVKNNKQVCNSNVYVNNNIPKLTKRMAVFQDSLIKNLVIFSAQLRPRNV